ncbi:MAG: hybrid sensor histidine kinase/response regulator [Magnetococcales bacterium]|nr:hybrid sensor histidine kinase/response regulator [Magnetococcales bacterium]
MNTGTGTPIVANRVEPRSPPLDQEALRNDLKRQRVLIVDDVAINIKTLVNILSAEYEISVAIHGAYALEIVSTTPVDLILLDVVMPVMDGYEVCRQLKANSATRHIPVIFITSNRDATDEIFALELGAVDFIAKPVIPAVVQARVRTHLGLIRALEQVQKKTTHLEITNTVLQNTIQQLNQTSAELVRNEKMASLGRLVAGFAHEINTPIGISITLISNIPEMTRQLSAMLSGEEVDEDELNTVLHQLNKSADLGLSSLTKAADLVRRFKRISTDQTSEEARLFNLGDLLQDIITTLHGMFGKTGIRITTHCPDVIQIHSRPGLISQVLTNFLMNSHKHAFDNGRRAGHISIEIRFEPDQRHLHIRYADDGRGIPQQNLPVIFEPFFTTARESGGSGLGLTICYNIITNQLNGSIACQSEEGAGVVFEVQLPIAPQPQAMQRDAP